MGVEGGENSRVGNGWGGERAAENYRLLGDRGREIGEN